MNLWNKVKQFLRYRAEIAAYVEVHDFIVGSESYKDFSCLKNLSDRLAYKEHLTATYTYRPDDDLLAKKQDFIDQYTVNEREQFDCFITKNPFDCSNKIKTHAWRNHEQVERRAAQKAWYKVVKRNYRAYMQQKFTANQNQHQ